MDAKTEQQIAPGAELGAGGGRAESDSDEPSTPVAKPRLEVSGTQVAAGALASVSAAVVASYFGTAGTMIGTAVASVVTTVGGAFYSVGLRRTGAKLRQTGAVLPIPPIRPALPRTRMDRWRAWLRQRRWGVAAGVGLVFVLALAVVSLIELVGQRPLSGMTGSDSSGTTSIGRVVSGDSDSDSGDQPDATTSTTTTMPDGTTPSTTTTVPDAEPEPETPTSSASSTTTLAEDGPTTTGAEPPAQTDQSTPPPADATPLPSG
jgi:hypothetical protein